MEEYLESKTRNAYIMQVGKSSGKQPRGRPKMEIQKDHKEIGCENGRRIKLTLCRVRRLALVLVRLKFQWPLIGQYIHPWVLQRYTATLDSLAISCTI